MLALVDKSARTVVEDISRSLLARLPYRRTLVILNSYLGHAHWLPFTQRSMLWASMKSKRKIAVLTVPGAPSFDLDRHSALCEMFWKRASYNGVPLYDAVIYSICNEAECLPHELTKGNVRIEHIISSWMNYALRTVDFLASAFAQRCPDSVLYLQGFFVECVAARWLAKTYGFRVFAWELAVDRRRLKLEMSTGEAVLNTSCLPEFLGLQKSAVGAASVAAPSLKKNPDHTSGGMNYRWPARRLKILAMMQVYTDSSQVFGTVDGISTVQLVRDALECARKLRGFVLIKLHPKELIGRGPIGTPLNSLTLRKLAMRGFPWGFERFRDWDMDRAAQYDTTSTLLSADVIVTLNSQAALEAAALGREVVLTGRSYFSDLELFWRASNTVALELALESIQRGERRNAAGLGARFLHYHLNSYCVANDARSFFRRVFADHHAPPHRR